MVNSETKIEIRPIPGRNGIKKFSQELEYFSRAHTLAPLVNPDSKRYATGLSEEDINYLKENNFPYDIENDTYVKGKPHEFWESLEVKVNLENSPTFLYPGKSLLDFVKWKFLLASKYIYSSEKEMKEGIKPEATHFIYNESIELDLRATEIEKRNELLVKLSDLSTKRKKDLILIIENEDTNDKNDNYLTVKLSEILGNKEKVSKLNNLLDQDENLTSLSAEIKTAIYKNVLTRTKKGIYYFEINLGFTEKDVREFLMKDENQEIYLTIKEKIEN